MSKYKAEMESLFGTITELGWKVIGVYDGEAWEKLNERDEVVEAVLGVDEAIIRVKKDDVAGNILVVLGNSPGELICDCSMSVEEILNMHMEKNPCACD